MITLTEFNRLPGIVSRLEFYTGYPCASLMLPRGASRYLRGECRENRFSLGILDLSRYLAVGGLEIGRIYMGNYAGPAPGDLQGIPQSYDPVRGVIYVFCEQCEHCG